MIRVEMSVQFLLSLAVALVFSLTTLSAIYGYDPEFFPNQDWFRVTKLSVSDRSDASVLLQWTKPEIHPNSYEIQISPDDKVIDIDDWTNTEVVLTKLTPGVEHTFSVVSIVSLDDGRELTVRSEAVSILINPSSPGLLLSYKIDLHSQHVELSWEKPRGHVNGYSVVLKNCMDEVIFKGTSKGTNTIIPLDTNDVQTAYTVDIYSLSNGAKSRPLTERIEMEDYYLLIGNLYATLEDNGDVKLTWQRPFCREIDSYEVQWAEEHSDQYNVIIEDSDSTSSIITDLTHKTYKFSVATVLYSKSGIRRVRSKPITIDRTPNRPGELWKSDVSSRSFYLRWDPSDGNVDHYMVMISEDFNFKKEYETKNPSILIKDLDENTWYRLEIYAVRNNLKSNSLFEKLKTKELKVYWGCMIGAILVGGIAGIGVSSFSPALGLFGFGAAGVGKGTLAASWMSTYGGSVASGGLFSGLQSLGVVGLSASAKAAVIASGMALGCIVEI